jgi:hypothetical protein
MGIPERIVISEKTLESRSVEVKNRKSGEVGRKGRDIIVK